MIDRTASDSRWRIPAIRYVLGLILLAAALLKILGTNVSAVPEIGWLSSARVQSTAIQWEFIVAAWLLSGYAEGGAWLAATATFLAFAVVSGYLGWVGQVDCGCLGPIRASPWYMFGLDIAALAALWLARTKPGLVLEKTGRGWKPLALPVTFILAIAAFVFGGACLAFGSIEGGVSWLRGETLVFSTRHIDFGEVVPGDAREASVNARNRSDRPIRLLGGTHSGVWSVISGLPLTLQPGETRAVTVKFSVPQWQPGMVTNSVDLVTDDAVQRRVRLQITCQVK